MLGGMLYWLKSIIQIYKVLNILQKKWLIKYHEENQKTKRATQVWLNA